MMFRSLLLGVVPLLAAGEVEEQSVLLQLKGRDQTRELLQRSKADLSEQTLRTLEENLMSKGGKDAGRAKCAYHLKTPTVVNGKTPCDSLKTVEKGYDKAFKEFRKFDKIGHKTIKSLMKKIKKALPALPKDLASVANFGLTAEGLEVKKLSESLQGTLADLKANGASPLGTKMSAAMGMLTDGAVADVKAAVATVQTNVKEVLSGNTVTVDDKTAFNPSEAVAQIKANSKKGFREASKMLEKYATQTFDKLMNTLGGTFAEFWATVLGTPDNYDFLSGIDWSKPRDVKKVQKKMFWNFAQGFLDEEAKVEDVCKSNKFIQDRPKKFEVRKICKSKKKPKCIDELVYFYESLDNTDDVCKVVTDMPRKVRGKKFTDAKFLDHCKSDTCKAHLMNRLGEDATEPWSSCKKPNDIRKACKTITKWEKGADKRAKKEKKRVEKEKKRKLKKQKKECKKACNNKDIHDTRSKRRACKKECNDLVLKE